MGSFVGNRYDFVNGDGVVVKDSPCRKCGQNVRGLAESEKCPRCQAPVQISVCGDFLQFAQPAWVHGVATRIYWIIWGVFIALLLGLLSLFVFSGQFVMQQYLALAGAAFSARGVWLMTRPDPSGIGEREPYNCRRLLRAGILGVLLLTSAQFVLLLLDGSLQRFIDLAWLRILGGLLLVVCEFAKLHYVEAIARRLPDESLESRARVLKWLMSAAAAALFALTIIGTLSLMLRGQSAAHSADVHKAFWTAGSLVFLILPSVVIVVGIGALAMSVLYRIAQRIREQAALARENWLRAISPPPPPTPETNAAIVASIVSQSEDLTANLAPLQSTGPSTPPVTVKVAHLMAAAPQAPAAGGAD